MTDSISPRVYRDCVAEFATGVAVVIAEHSGEAAGMTLNSFTSVSLDPLLVLVSLRHGSRTLSAVVSSERFTVSVLEREQRSVAVDFATPGAPFPSAQVSRAYDGMLVVSGAVANLLCQVHDMVRAGDHDLVVGRVTGITHGGGEPLVFHRGRFGGLVTDAEAPAGHPIALIEGAGW